MAQTKVKAVLDILESTLKGISPEIGKVHATLRGTHDPAEAEDDFSFDDPVVGKNIIKVFFIRPSDGSEEQQSLAGGSLAVAVQNYEITGLISVEKDHGTENVLEDEMERIRSAVRALKGRTSPLGASPVNGSLEPRMRWSPIERVSFAHQICHAKSLTLSVQFPQLV